ncbi:hypothetical protein B7P43_G05057 [Cryptotermes secundus]|uniref:WW domain-containing protein n=1 Tax=Cryptotermes secundus TaxID=105785 RepID=A0A2J7PQI8_9NEOP|nr:hypothetical protein B7P43_G05057 [Cryptotermes secundus]
MALNPDSEQHKGNLVVRIDEDSDSDLQALFDSVLKPDSKRPLQVPLRMRKLPNSFFNPPSPASLQQTYASAQQQQHGHLKQRSYDITPVDELGPLPPGWAQARTPEGQVYYLK